MSACAPMYNPPMQKWKWYILLIPILLLAAVLRLYGNDWDRYEQYHPDERYIAWVAATIRAPDSLSDALNPQSTTFNPYYWPGGGSSECIIQIEDEPRDFAYGHLPLYLTVTSMHIVERVAPTVLDNLEPTCRNFAGELVPSSIARVTAVGRALTALFDVGTVLFIFLIGRKLFGNAEAIIAALLLTLTVTHIQLAHFFTTDPYMTFFVVAALYAMIRTQQAVYPGLNLFAAALLTGFAIGSKFSAVLLLLPLMLAWYWGRALVMAQTRQGLRILSSLTGTLFTVAIAFAITNPFAVLDYSCTVPTEPFKIASFTIPTIDWRSCFVYNISKQGGMVNGSANFPFTRQYFGTLPYLYFLEMQLRWGMGWLLGSLGIIGSVWALVRHMGRLRWTNLRGNSAQPVVRPSARPQWLVLAWCVPFFISTGNFFVKFMRYWQPLVPFMVLFGVGFLWSWRWRWLRRTAVLLVTLFTSLYAFSFVNIYQEAHPWVTASVWAYDNIAPDSLILHERWGDRLPSTLIIDGTQLSPSNLRYQGGELTWLSGTGGLDGVDKWVDNLQQLATADYIIIESNRIYGVVPRLPELYPLSSRVHKPLFDGSLGYEAVFATSRMPHIGRFHLKPDFFSWPNLPMPSAVQEYYDSLPGINMGRVDESFTLYDQSLVMVFENKERFSAEQLNQILAEQ